MKIKNILAAAISAVMLTGCSSLLDETADITYEITQDAGDSVTSAVSERPSCRLELVWRK